METMVVVVVNVFGSYGGGSGCWLRYTPFCLAITPWSFTVIGHSWLCDFQNYSNQSDIIGPATTLELEKDSAAARQGK